MTLRTPQEVIDTLTPEKEIIFRAAMEVIIKGIEEKFNSDSYPLKLFLYCSEENIKSIKRKITRTLHEKDWDIVFCPTQHERDGDITPVLISIL